MSDSKSRFDFGSTFDRDDTRDSVNNVSQNENRQKKESALADICDICHGHTDNIIFHLRANHPDIYQHMIEG